jgi:PAS domain S-box-containing protein
MPDRTTVPCPAPAPIRRSRSALLRVLLLIGCWAGAAGAPAAPPPPASLTPAQRQWLAEHDGRIRIGITAIPPQVIRERDQYHGLSIDYIRLLERRLGTRFALVPYATWNEVIEAARARRIDMIFAAQQTPERLHYLRFTEPYIEMPNIIFVRNDRAGGAELRTMKGWTVAVSAGSAVQEYLQRGFPDLALRPVADELTGLRMLALGEVDAMVAEIARASYYIEKDGIQNLRVAGEAGLLYRLRFAVRSDWPELRAILDAGLAAVTDEERREIVRRWTVAGEPDVFSSREIWLWFLAALGVLALVLGAAFAWSRLLHRRVQQRTAQLQEELAARRQAEDALRYERALLARIMETSPVGITMVNRDGAVTFANDRAVNILGLTKSEVTQRTYNAPQWRITDFDGGTFPDEKLPFRRVLTTRQPVFDVRHAIEWPDGRRVRLSISGAPLLDGAGEVENVVFAIEDVSERTLSEQATRQSEQLFRALVENSPDHIARYDRECRRIYVNPAIQKLFAEPSKEVLGKMPTDKSPVRDPLAYIGHVKHVLETGMESVTEMPVRYRTGEWRWSHMRFIPEFGLDGKVATVLAIGHDVQDIRERESRFRTLAENFPDFIARFDRDYRYAYINPALEKALGVPAEAILGKTPHELPSLRSPEQNDALRVAIHRTFAEGITGESEVHWKTPQGERIFELRLVPERDAAGHVVAVIEITHDVTENRLAQQQRLTHLRFLEAMDRVNRAMQASSDLDQTMRDVLDVVLSVFNCDRAFLMYPCDPEAPVWSVPMERNKPEYPGVLQLGLEMPMDPDVARTLRLLRAANCPVKFGPGTAHPLPPDVAQQFGFKCFMSMAIHPKVGQPWQFGIHQCSHARNWTAEEERLFQEIGRRLADGMTSLLAHRDLRERQAELTEAQRLGRIGSWKWDIATGVIAWSPENYRIYGRDPARPLPAFEQHLTTYTPESAARLAAAAKKGTATGEAYELDLEIAQPEPGAARWITARGEATRDAQGRIVGLHGTSQDITARKLAEERIRELNLELERHVADRTAQLETTNRELEAFAYSVSHDLRIPLRAIDGYRGLLEKRIAGALDDESRRYMKSISSAATRMGTLIDDLLSFSRMGRREMSKQAVELGAIVRDAMGELAPETGGRTVHWRIAELPTVTGDPAMLRVVFVNLLSNALKFTRLRPAAEIEVGVRETENETVVFVRDNGVGFDMQYADKLFGVFERLHGVEEFEGSGVGLANVRRIISRHGGRTWAEGRVDEGATFCFSLPRA